MSHQPATHDSTYLTLLDSVDAVIYVADMQTYELLFMNKMAQETSGGSLGGKCWATLQADQTGPCTFCTNDRLLDEDGNPKPPYVWEFQNTLNKEWYECRDQAVLWPDGRLVRMEIATNITERKRAEETIHANEERFRELFENMSSGVAVYRATEDGLDFIFTNFNRAAEKIENLKREDVIGRKVTELFPRAEEFGFLAIFQRVWKTGNPENFPLTAYKDQRIQGWRENYVYKLPSGEIVAIYDDVTAQKQAEHEIIRKKNALSFALSGANSGMWDWNLGTNRVSFDENYYTMVGYEPFEFPMHFEEWERRVHPEDIDRVKTIIQDSLEKSENQFTAEFRFKTKTNGWMWILAQGRIVEWDTKGNPLRFIGLHTGIDQLKKTELELLESRENLRITLNSIGDAVIATDLNHNIVTMNPVAEQLTGWTEQEALGKPLGHIFHIENASTGKKVTIPVEEALKTGQIVALANNTSLIAKNGRKSQIADSAAPIINEKNELTGAVLVFRDVTEEYLLKNELQKIQQLEKIGALAGGLAHDFNNILSGIFGNITLAKMRITEDHPCIKYLNQAEISANRAKNLTNKLLTFAKGGEPVKDSVSLAKLVKEVAEFDLSGSNIKLIFHATDNLWPAEVDKGQIQQVFSNLVINAAQAMPTGGHLYIDLQNREYLEHQGTETKPGRYVQATIRDEGIGIDKARFLQIFDPYYSTKQTGRGLGLATVYSIITKHHGHIQVESTPGQGTLFTLHLPAGDGDSTQNEEPLEKAEVGVDACKVLLMDDDEVIRTLTPEILDHLGCVTTTASTGEIAISLYQQALTEGKPFDLIIMDLTIPGGMGGREAIKALLAIDPQVKAIVSSGYADDPVMAHYADYGFKGVATKPYTVEELTKVLDAVLKL